MESWGNGPDQYLNSYYVLDYVFFNSHHNPVKKLVVGRTSTYVFAAKNLCTSYAAPVPLLCIPCSLNTENKCISSGLGLGIY